MFALIMEAVGMSETSVNFYQTTPSNIPESHLLLCCFYSPVTDIFYAVRIRGEGAGALQSVVHKTNCPRHKINCTARADPRVASKCRLLLGLLGRYRHCLIQSRLQLTKLTFSAETFNLVGIVTCFPITPM
jgi:hypothetical protein